MCNPKVLTVPLPDADNLRCSGRGLLLLDREIDDVSYAKLRFLAKAAYVALSNPDPGSTFSSEFGAFGSSSHAELLITFLEYSLPVLEMEPAHRELLVHIEEALAEIGHRKPPDQRA